jgi:CheY-like chemotaxis protein
MFWKMQLLTHAFDPQTPSSARRTALERQETILVVDDNRDNVEILSAFLESRGYRVASAQDGKAALAKLEEVHPSLVLLDVMMPGMDGWQVCRTIKRHPEFGSTRVVMVTAKGGFEDKFEGMQSGADDYVVKPVDLDELAEKVERNLAAGRGQRP